MAVLSRTHMEAVAIRSRLRIALRPGDLDRTLQKEHDPDEEKPQTSVHVIWAQSLNSDLAMAS